MVVSVVRLLWSSFTETAGVTASRWAAALRSDVTPVVLFRLDPRASFILRLSYGIS